MRSTLAVGRLVGAAALTLATAAITVPAGATGPTDGTCSNSNYTTPPPSGQQITDGSGTVAWLDPQPGSDGSVAGTGGISGSDGSLTAQGDSSAGYFDAEGTGPSASTTTVYADGSGVNVCVGAAGVGADANVPVAPSSP